MPALQCSGGWHGRIPNSRPARTTQWVPGQPEVGYIMRPCPLPTPTLKNLLTVNKNLSQFHPNVFATYLTGRSPDIIELVSIYYYGSDKGTGVCWWEGDFTPPRHPGLFSPLRWNLQKVTEWWERVNIISSARIIYFPFSGRQALATRSFHSIILLQYSRDH